VILGIHASVRRGLLESLSEAGPLGVEAVQILPYQRHHIPNQEEFARFREARKRAAISRLIVHSRFVPSLGSNDADRRRRSIELLSRELAIAAALGAQSYVLHAGAYSPGGGSAEAERLLVQAVREAALASESTLPILLENVPGGGRRMGAKLEDLARMLESLRRLSIPCGFCLDTAHAWAAGYDLASNEGLAGFMDRAESLAGVEAIRLFHLNDTQVALGSHLENHWHWGQGRLSLGPGIAALLARAGYENVAAILETPKEPGADGRNLAYVRDMVKRGAADR